MKKEKELFNVIYKKYNSFTNKNDSLSGETHIIDLSNNRSNYYHFRVYNVCGYCFDVKKFNIVDLNEYLNLSEKQGDGFMYVVECEYFKLKDINNIFEIVKYWLK